MRWRCVYLAVEVNSDRASIERRVGRAAEAALAERKFVNAIDVLVGVGWLEQRKVEEWRQGRVDYLEGVTVQASCHRLFRAPVSSHRFSNRPRSYRRLL